MHKSATIFKISKLKNFQGGLAGALAQLTLGVARSAEQQAYEESMRRQCWEAGNIDYLGKGLNLKSTTTDYANKNNIFLHCYR